MHKQPSRKPVVLLLALCCLAALVGGTYAAYTYPTSGQVKRVVAAQTNTATEAQRFSSNYLRTDSTNGFTPVSVPQGSGGDVSVAITICNYPQFDASLFHPSDITYTISCTVKNASGKPVSSSITLDGTGDAKTLPGGTMSHNLHTLHIPSNELEALRKGNYIDGTATPTTPGFSPLSAKLKIFQATAQQTGWVGRLTGDETDDALNYQIHGTQAGTLTLSWDSSVVSLSKRSAAALGASDTAASPLTISVGGKDKPTSYLLQFYWADGTKNAADAQITCSFKAS